jgi:hypothetical protein
MSQRTFRTQTPLQALLVEQALLLARQLGQAADDAPDGQALTRVEQLALPAGREFLRRAVEAALRQQAQAAGKKGRKAAPAPAAAASGTRGAPPAPP